MSRICLSRFGPCLGYVLSRIFPCLGYVLSRFGPGLGIYFFAWTLSCKNACFRAYLRGRVRVFFFSLINSQPCLGYVCLGLVLSRICPSRFCPYNSEKYPKDQKLF